MVRPVGSHHSPDRIVASGSGETAFSTSAIAPHAATGSAGGIAVRQAYAPQSAVAVRRRRRLVPARRPDGTSPVAIPLALSRLAGGPRPRLCGDGNRQLSQRIATVADRLDFRLPARSAGLRSLSVEQLRHRRTAVAVAGNRRAGSDRILDRPRIAATTVSAKPRRSGGVSLVAPRMGFARQSSDQGRRGTRRRR